MLSETSVPFVALSVFPDTLTRTKGTSHRWRSVLCAGYVHQGAPSIILCTDCGLWVTYDYLQACEKQEHCREAALDLLDQLDDFMKIGASVPELDGRVKSVQPVQDMLRLIDDIVGYVRKHTKGDYSGKQLMEMALSSS